MVNDQDNPPSPLRETPNLDSLTSQEGAQTLADRVALYWAARGHRTVRVWIWKTPPALHSREKFKHIMWCVRSNLIGGLPPP